MQLLFYFSLKSIFKIKIITINKNKSLEAAEIYSDKQLNNDGYIIAEGDVLVIYKNMILSRSIFLTCFLKDLSSFTVKNMQTPLIENIIS